MGSAGVAADDIAGGKQGDTDGENVDDGSDDGEEAEEDAPKHEGLTTGLLITYCALGSMAMGSVWVGSHKSIISLNVPGFEVPGEPVTKTGTQPCRAV